MKSNEADREREVVRVINETLSAAIEGHAELATTKRAKVALKAVRKALQRLGMSDSEIESFDDLPAWALTVSRRKTSEMADAKAAAADEREAGERDLRAQLRAELPNLSDDDLAAYVDDPEEGARLLADARRAQRAAILKKANYASAGFTMSDLLTVDDLDNLEDPTWLVDELIPEGVVAGLVGETGSLKSTLALDFACSVAVGAPAIGELATEGPRRVLFIAGEGKQGLRQRIAAYAAHRGLGADARKLLRQNVAVKAGPVNLLASDEIEAVRSAVDEGEFDLVIWDTLSTHTAGADENSSGDMATALRSARYVISGRSRASALVLHHPVKNGNALDGRGSGAYKANLDVMLATERDGDGGLVRLTVEKSKDSATGVPRILRKTIVDLPATTSSAGIPHPSTTSVVVELTTFGEAGAFGGRKRNSLDDPKRLDALADAFMEIIDDLIGSTPTVRKIRDEFRSRAKGRPEWSGLGLTNGSEKLVAEHLARAGRITLGVAERERVRIYPPGADLPRAVEAYDLADVSPPAPLDLLPFPNRPLTS